MTTEELLKPRYKVIADFPRNCAHIDRVFEPGEIGIETQIKWEDYPHLFKKLQWWEERKESDMPEYLKKVDKNTRVTNWIILEEHENEPYVHKVIKYNPKYIFSFESNYLNITYFISYFIPATLLEYENQK